MRSLGQESLTYGVPEDQLLSKIADEFLSTHPRSSWATGTPTLLMNDFKGYLNKYQDPQQADSILKIQKVRTAPGDGWPQAVTVSAVPAHPEAPEHLTNSLSQELDETKITLHKTIESVLQRGEKIDGMRPHRLSMR